MSERITVLFTNIRRFHGTNADGESEYWCPQENKEYCVTLEHIDDTLVYLTFPNGFRLGFLPPGHSTNYTVVREGWVSDAGPLATLVNKLSPPSVPILESVLVLEIKPENLSYGRVRFSLPRILSGMLVDRGFCSQEVCYNVDDCPAGDELCGFASFMLINRNGNLRYFCTTFRVDNKTSKKNLTLQHGSGSI